jgi:sugar phosphate isomerase/epimerase
VLIVNDVGGKYVIGPLGFEQMYIGRSSLDAMVDPLKELGRYAHGVNPNIIVAPERLRHDESKVFLTLDDVLHVLDKVKLDNVRYQEDTEHLVENEMGRNISFHLQRGLDSGYLAYCHGSEWGKWNTPENRAEFRPGGPVNDQLPEIMQTFVNAGYKGVFSLEVPHILFYKALGQADPNNYAEAPRQIQDQLAYGRAAITVARTLQVFMPLKKAG